MGKYYADLPENAEEFDFQGETYSAGDRFESDEPCDLVDFYNAFKATNPTLGRVNRTRHFWQDMEALCAATGSGTTPAPPADGQSTAGTDGPPPGGEDSAEAQGALSVPPGVDGADQSAPASDQTGTGEGEPREQPPGEPDPNHSDETSQNPARGGDPVDLFAGTFVVQETDFDLSTTALPLTLERRYHSGSVYFGPFGWGWDHNHNSYLRELNDGRVALWTGQLNEDVYEPRGDGTFVPPRGVFVQLERLPGPIARYLARGVEGIETHFERPPGWTDALRIPITTVRDRFGNALIYTYGTDSRLQEVRDAADRFLHFYYGECGILEAISDHSGRTVHYLHQADVEHLVGVMQPATSDHPGGITKIYHYESAHLPPALRHNIARVEDGSGNIFVQNTYEHDPSQWHFARVIEQLYGEYLFQYRYTQLQYVPAHENFVNVPSVRAEVMTPDLALHTHTFNYRGDLLDYRFRLSRDHSFRVAAYAYEYDSQGNRIRTVLPDGGEEVRTYASADPDPRMRGRLLQRELRARAGFPAPSRIVFRAQYEPRFQLLKKIYGESGHATEYLYDFDLAPDPSNAGRLEKIVLPDVGLPDGSLQSAELNVSIDARGRMASLITPSGAVRIFEYGIAGDAVGLPTRTIFDANGLAIDKQLTYDANGNVRTSVDGEAAEGRFFYNALDQLEEFWTPEVSGRRGRIRVHYDADRFIVAVDRPRGDYADPTMSDPFIRDTVVRNVLGHAECITYGANTSEPRIFTRCTDYRGNVLEETDPEGAVTRQVFDERGSQLSSERLGPDGSRTLHEWVYDRSGRLVLERWGSATPVSQGYEYDAFGRLSKVILPNKSEHTFVYGPEDVITEEVLTGDDGAGLTRVLAQKMYAYDERQRLVRESRLSFADDPAMGVVLSQLYTYDSEDRLVRMEDHRGAVHTITYDGLNRETRRVDPVGNEVLLEYDRENRKVAEERKDLEAGGTVTRRWEWDYDARSRLTSATGPGGGSTFYEYDDRDALVRIQQPLGLERTMEYGHLGELQQLAIDPTGLGIYHRWSYDGRGRPVSYVDPMGEATTCAYDGLGRSRHVLLPNGFGSSRVYDDDGRVSRETLASGVVIDFGYDTAGRLHRISAVGVPIAATVADHIYRYDGRNLIVEARVGSRSTIRQYDSLARLISEESDGSIHRREIDDLAGTIDRLWADGRRERLETDVMGRPRKLSRVTAGTVGDDVANMAEIQFAGPGAIERIRTFDSLVGEIRFDVEKRAVSMLHRVGAAVVERADYRYDARGRTRYAGSLLQGLARYHEYDAGDRLVEAREEFPVPALSTGFDLAQQSADIGAVQTAAAAAAEQFGFAYDVADARTQHTHTGDPPQIYTYAPGKRLSSAGLETFSFSPDGVREHDALNQYTQDALGRITRVTSSDGTTTLYEFDYDGFGRVVRLRETGQPEIARAYFDEGLVEESRGASLWRQYTRHPLAPTPLAIHQAGESLVPVFDGRLNQVGMFDKNIVNLERYAYRPFGRPRILAPDGTPRTQSSLGMSPVFGGMNYLPRAGLFEARRRFLDPRHGSFLSTDPFGTLDSPNVYAYARYDPADLVDPEGEFAFLAGLLIAAAVGMAIGGGLNAARQGIAIAEGSQDGWDWGQFGLSVGIGAIAGPVLVVAPELAVPLAAYGVTSGAYEISQGNYYTGAFDVVAAVAPFGFKGVRSGAVGRGSLLGEVRGLGRSAPFSTRVGRFRLIGNNARHLLPALRGRRIGLGFSRMNPTSPEGHTAVIVENSEGGFWFVEKNAARFEDGRLVANFRESPEPLEYYSRKQGRTFEYESIRVGEDAVRSANEYAQGRLKAHLVEPFDPDCANCSHFANDVLGAAGLRGFGNGRASGLWSDFTNFGIARSMLLGPYLGLRRRSEEEGEEGEKK